MRDRPIFVFFAGFAVGLIFLTALLWQSGKLRTANAAPVPPTTPAASVRLTPPQKPSVANPAVPEDRSASPSRLLIPVEGVNAADLHDNFNDMRAGHRHEALDIMAPRGTSVLAAGQGTVVKLFLSKPGGLTVYQFDETGVYCYYYAHLDRYADGLREGTVLKRGEVLGYVGSTGNASPSAPHLHFAIFKLGPDKRWWEGTPIDPYESLAGSVASR